MTLEINLSQIEKMPENEIILYQTDNQNNPQLEVRIEDETVWLNRQQISDLFNRDVKTIGKHINNVFSEGELNKISTVAKFATVQNEGGRLVERQVEYYNLDVIISVGYRVKSKQGTQFRIWANKILKDYLLKGYVVNQRLEQVEKKVFLHEQQIEKLVRTSLPPQQGIFYDGQIYDAWIFATDLIKSAKNSIILIDNYVDETVLTLLSKRKKNVLAEIFTQKISKQFHLDIQKYNAQYDKIEVKEFTKSHDRFLIIDQKEIYLIGASLKDLGKKWFAFSRISLNAEEMIKKLQ